MPPARILSNVHTMSKTCLAEEHVGGEGERQETRRRHGKKDEERCPGVGGRRGNGKGPRPASPYKAVMMSHGLLS